MMLRSFLIPCAATLALAACESRAPYYGTSTAPPPAYRSPGAAQNAYQGCASGQAADLLHQNRPGGSDYDPSRCREEGY